MRVSSAVRVVMGPHFYQDGDLNVKSGSIRVWSHETICKAKEVINSGLLIFAGKNNDLVSTTHVLFMYSCALLEPRSITPAMLIWEGLGTCTPTTVKDFKAKWLPRAQPDTSKYVGEKGEVKHIVHLRFKLIPVDRLRGIPPIGQEYSLWTRSILSPSPEDKTCFICSQPGQDCQYTCHLCGQWCHSISCSTRVGELAEATSTCSLCGVSVATGHLVHGSPTQNGGKSYLMSETTVDHRIQFPDRPPFTSPPDVAHTVNTILFEGVGTLLNKKHAPGVAGYPRGKEVLAGQTTFVFYQGISLDEHMVYVGMPCGDEKWVRALYRKRDELVQGLNVFYVMVLHVPTSNVEIELLPSFREVHPYIWDAASKDAYTDPAFKIIKANVGELIKAHKLKHGDGTGGRGDLLPDKVTPSKNSKRRAAHGTRQSNRKRTAPTIYSPSFSSPSSSAFSTRTAPSEDIDVDEDSEERMMTKPSSSVRRMRSQRLAA
jgi:hypothetical protein